MVLGLLNRVAAKAATSAAVGVLAKRVSSPEAFGNGINTAFGHESVEAFFQKYGTTAKKFTYDPIKNLYVGYVSTPERREEFLSLIVMGEREGSVAASFVPEVRWGQDILGLMQKKEFADRVVAAVGPR